jgi:mRNA interferase MazF
MQPWPTKIELPEQCRTRGMVLVDQIRAVDRHARPFHFIEKCPDDFVTFVRGHIARLLEIPILQ